MRLVELWQKALLELEAGRTVYLCWVVAQKKGTPGTTAARMLLTQAGEQLGTIGGGIMEKEVLTGAQSLMVSGERLRPRLRRLRHRRDASEEASGLICGGEQTNLEMILSPALDTELVRQILVATTSESTACLEITAAGMQLIERNEALDTRARLVDEGAEWCVQLGFRAQRRIAIYGGGHCGEALADLMQRLDYVVTLIDPRADVLERTRLPEAVRCLPLGFEEAAAQVDYPAETIAAVMTYSMLTDIEALCGALRVGFSQIGLMGSQVKIAFIRESLRQKGFSDLQIDTIRAPIGLNFNSDTPSEIAVSIAAQILLERNSS